LCISGKAFLDIGIITGYTDAVSLDRKTISARLQETILILDKPYFLVSMISILETGSQISARIGNTIAEMSGKFPKSLSQFSRLSSGSWSRTMRIFLSSQSHSDAVMLARQCWWAKQIRLRTNRSMLRCTYTGRETLLALLVVAHRCITI
jgi:hypothetical protein